MNMFRVMVDHGGDLKTGIRSYSGLVSAKKERLSAAEYTKMLTACNDDGAIILKLIKSLLEPLSPDLVKAYAGEEAGVGLHRKCIGRSMVRALCCEGLLRGIICNRRG